MVGMTHHDKSKNERSTFDYHSWKRRLGLHESGSEEQAVPWNKPKANDSADWAWALRKLSVVKPLEYSRTEKEEDEEETCDGALVDPSATKESSGVASSENGNGYIPQCLHMHYTATNDVHCDKEGHPIIQVFPARINLHQQIQESTFVDLFALYIHAKQQRHTDMKFNILIDTRPGYGWPNEPAIRLVSWIRHVASDLHRLFPNALHQCLLVPVPRPAIWIWNLLIRPCLEPSLRKIIHLVPGRASLESNLPPRVMASYVDDSVLEHLEQQRKTKFNICE